MINVKEEMKENNLYYELQGMEEEKKQLLWEILMEADFSNKTQMRDLVYKFGSEINNKDKFGRMLFVRLATLF